TASCGAPTPAGEGVYGFSFVFSLMTRRPAAGCSPGTYGGTARTDARIQGAALMRSCYGAAPAPATGPPSARGADLGRTRPHAVRRQVPFGHLDREALAVRQA